MGKKKKKKKGQGGLAQKAQDIMRELQNIDQNWIEENMELTGVMIGVIILLLCVIKKICCHSGGSGRGARDSARQLEEGFQDTMEKSQRKAGFEKMLRFKQRMRSQRA